MGGYCQVPADVHSSFAKPEYSSFIAANFNLRGRCAQAVALFSPIFKAVY